MSDRFNVKNFLNFVSNQRTGSFTHQQRTILIGFWIWHSFILCVEKMGLVNDFWKNELIKCFILDCKTYMTLINFGGISNGNIVVAQGLSLHSQNSSHSHGTVWQSPNIYNSAMTPEKTGLLPVVSVSCHGCDAIRAPICDGKFVAHK